MVMTAGLRPAFDTIRKENLCVAFFKCCKMNRNSHFFLEEDVLFNHRFVVSLVDLFFSYYPALYIEYFKNVNFQGARMTETDFNSKFVKNCNLFEHQFTTRFSSEIKT